MKDYANEHKVIDPQLIILHTSHDSPFTFDVAMEVEGEYGTGEKEVSPVLTKAVEKVIYDISKGDSGLVPEWVSDKTLKNIPVNINGRSWASYTVADEKVTLPALGRPPLDSIDMVGSITRYEGTVDVINVHNENENFFNLYPISGPKKVKCVFDKKDFLSKIKDSIEQKASVTGKVTKCKEVNGFLYPTAISVREFEQLSHKDDPPLDIDSLVDRFQTPPDVDAVKWVRKIRDEWDDE